MKLLNIFDLVIQEIMLLEEDLGFVQIGAHDGLHYDPIRPYILKHNWSGILVEPQPDIFERLKKNYVGYDLRLKFDQCAISDHDGTMTLYVPDGTQKHDSATMLASSRKDAVEKSNPRHGYTGGAVGIEVPCCTLATLLSRHGVESLDLLQIDAEGYDLAIIDQLEKTILRPTAISFEHGFYSGKIVDDCYEKLSGMGYSIAPSHIDTIAYRQADNYPRAQYEEEPIPS